MLTRFLIAFACLALGPVMAKDIARGGQIYSHGSIRNATEAVVSVAAELVANIHAGQQVSMDVRQGTFRGVVKDVRSPVEILIALDARRLQVGQAVIAVIQLDPDCDCEQQPFPTSPENL